MLVVQVGIVVYVYIDGCLIIFCIPVNTGKCFESLKLNFFIDNVEIVVKSHGLNNSNIKFQFIPDLLWGLLLLWTQRKLDSVREWASGPVCEGLLWLC